MSEPLEIDLKTLGSDFFADKRYDSFSFSTFLTEQELMTHIPKRNTSKGALINKIYMVGDIWELMVLEFHSP